MTALMIDDSSIDQGISALFVRWDQVAEKVLAFFKAEGRFVNLLLLNQDDMKSLNLEFRGKDKPTDVLSWEYEDDMIPDELASEFPWGEMAICIPVAEEQAKNNGWDLDTEMIRLLVHGMVHLAGYDHELSEQAEREMLSVEKQLLTDCAGLSSIYS